MKKIKVIRLFSLILCLMLLPSCTDPSIPVTKAEVKEYPLSGELEGGGRWFFAEIDYHFKPLEGTKEYEIAEYIDVNTTLVNGEMPLTQGTGSIVRIEYDGEILLPSGYSIPIISTVYSITRVLFPFVSSSGDTYMASYNNFGLRWDDSDLKNLCINRKSGDEHVHAPYLFKAESLDELYNIYTAIGSVRNVNDTPEQAFKEFCGNIFNEDFFKDNILLLTCFTASSGGDDFALKDVKIADGCLTLEIMQTRSGVTCDLGGWSAVVAVDRKIANNITEFEADNPYSNW